MKRSEYKKIARTTFEGQCKCGGAWSERVRTDKQANRAERRSCKASLIKIIKEWN